ncbi:hypothetical protein [Metabacillus idriensis]|nr:hypothetical protein [Metabacillus idriensis]
MEPTTLYEDKNPERRLQNGINQLYEDKNLERQLQKGINHAV